MITFKCDSIQYQRLFDRAVEGLYNNRRQFTSETGPVLIEGGVYPGVWMECAPLEGMVFAPFDMETAKNNHRVFYRFQKEDGQFPSSVGSEQINYAQIQQTVPIIETAEKLAALSNDEEFLLQSYEAWGKWDQWLSVNRDTRKRNLCEAFCEYDTGHDNSYRFKGLAKFCPDKNAAICPDYPALPYAAPDLSATLYGGRMAMSRIARKLGRHVDEEKYLQLAELTKQAIFEHCYDEELEFFFDRTAEGNLIKCVSDTGLRVLMEHVVDQQLFDRIYQRYIINPEAFWTDYPIPSVAANSTGFVNPPPENCWGGASQALMALRAPLYLEHYGKYDTLNEFMRRWINSMLQCSEFMQQMDPFTGQFSTSPGYSPSMCCVISFISKMIGIQETEDEISWGCNILPEIGNSYFKLELYKHGEAEIEQRQGESILRLCGKKLAKIRGKARLFTNKKGKLLRIAADSSGQIHIETREQCIMLNMQSGDIIDCDDALSIARNFNIVKESIVCQDTRKYSDRIYNE
jgi:Mannosylglycerate hydrolase MGH1-like glycoside hydrolase domain